MASFGHLNQQSVVGGGGGGAPGGNQSNASSKAGGTNITGATAASTQPQVRNYYLTWTNAWTQKPLNEFVWPVASMRMLVCGFGLLYVKKRVWILLKYHHVVSKWYNLKLFRITQKHVRTRSETNMH